MFDLRRSFTDSDDEAPINVKPNAEMSLPPSTQPKTLPKNMVRMYDPDEDEYYLITKTKYKDNTEDIVKPKPEP